MFSKSIQWMSNESVWSKKKEKKDKSRTKNSSRFSRCQGTNGRDRRRSWMVSEVKIQAFSRRHVQRTRQGTDAYYKSRRGPVRKGNVGGQEREKTRPAGMRDERKDRTRGGVDGSMRSRSYITRQYLRRTTVNQ